jgi:hypothetical protein
VSKHPQPQINVLDYLYKQLITQTVQVTDFIKAMTLLSALPPHWEEIITAQVMQAGTITGIIYDVAKVAIYHHWDTLSARKEGKRSEKVSKISSISRKGPTPSFQQQTAPPSHGSISGSSKKKGKHGVHRKGKGKVKGQGYGKIYLVSTISLTLQTSHSIATITPQGLLQRIAVEDPKTSSFGNGPYASFNIAMTLAQHIGDCPSLRTVQALEEQVLDAPISMPTPCSSPPPLSAADSMELHNTFGYTATEIANISLCFLPYKHILHMVPEPDLTSK